MKADSLSMINRAAQWIIPSLLQNTYCTACTHTHTRTDKDAGNTDECGHLHGFKHSIYTHKAHRFQMGYKKKCLHFMQKSRKACLFFHFLFYLCMYNPTLPILYLYVSSLEVYKYIFLFL